jgi:hypothetical protein
MQVQGLNALHAGVDGLDEAGLLERDAVGDADGALRDDPIHNPHVIGETAAGRLESGRAADSLVGRTLGKGLVLAIETVAARYVMEDHHAVARKVIGHAFANGSDHAGGFVPENAGGGVRACGNLFKVGAANAAGVDAD